MVDAPHSMAPARFIGLASSVIEGGRLRLQTLVLIRWIALAGQALAIVVVKFGLGFDMAFVPALLVVAVSIGLNTVLTVRYAPTTRLSDLQAALYLAYDTLQLAILLYLTGGIENPFSMLMLVPVTVSATVLSLRSTVLLGVLGLACLSFVTINHQALPWHGDWSGTSGLVCRRNLDCAGPWDGVHHRPMPGASPLRHAGCLMRSPKPRWRWLASSNSLL